MHDLLPVLVIEDEACLLSFFTAALVRDGLKVVGASSGAEALQLLESGDFVGIVSDLRMAGGIDGADVYAWVRQNRPELSRRFIFVSGDIHAADAVQIRERTGALFLEKPFRLGELLAIVRKITALGESYA